LYSWLWKSLFVLCTSLRVEDSGFLVNVLFVFVLLSAIPGFMPLVLGLLLGLATLLT